MTPDPTPASLRCSLFQRGFTRGGGPMSEAVTPVSASSARWSWSIAASAWLGFMDEKRIEKERFRQDFLGNRGLGLPWAAALTATVQAAGTFMGFPSLVYALAGSSWLWIAGYMVVPLTGFSVLAEAFRLALAADGGRHGPRPVPRAVRARDRRATTASLMIMFFMSTMMIAQFKAGAIVMKLAWPSSEPMRLTEEQADFEFNRDALETLRKANVPAALVAKLEPAVGSRRPPNANCSSEPRRGRRPKS